MSPDTLAPQAAAGVEEPKPDYEASLDFLKRFRPGGPSLLVAIHPDRKAIEGKTFRDPAEIHPWLEELGRTHNLYFTANPTLRDVDDKCKREDIAALDWLHVDVDPDDEREKKDGLAAERDRALAKLTTGRPPNVPEPTILIDSGGGYQGLWKLDSPILINGEVERYEDAKRYNQQLELLFEADHCHNVDRILRLPGTLNRPNAEKKKKGRQVVRANLIEFDETRVYPAGRFGRAPLETSGPGYVAGKIDTSLRVDDLDDLGLDLPKKTVETIWAGKLDEHESRSEAVLGVACALVRAGANDSVIYAILMDERYPISESVLEKKSGAHKYAVRQVERAREKVAESKLKPTDGRPLIELPGPPGSPRQYRDTAADLAPIVAGQWYRRGRVPFTVDDETRMLEAVEKARAVTALEEMAAFFDTRYDKKNVPHQRAKTLTKTDAEILLGSDDLLAGLPEIRVISECPVLLERDGELVAISGFDGPSGILTRGGTPTETSFDEARDLLLGLIRDFDFAEETDRARLVAAMISPALNTSGMLGTARIPLTILEADDSHAGKGTAARMIAGIYGVAKLHGIAQRDRADRGPGGFGEDIAKALVEGRSFVNLDNIRGRVNSQFLEMVLTEPSVSCRVPHYSSVAVDPSGTTFLMTSNGADVTGDLANRSSIVRIRKRPGDYRYFEWPEGRPDQHVIANQPAYLGAVWTILRDWHRQGKSTATLAGEHDFRPWAMAVRYICVELLGLADPFTDARAIRKRVSSMDQSWLRQVALQVEASRQTGLDLKTSDLLDYAIGAEIDLPVKFDPAGGQEAREKAVLGLGRSLAAAFRKSETGELRIDHLRVIRREVPRTDDPSKPTKVYVVESDRESEPAPF